MRIKSKFSYFFHRPQLFDHSSIHRFPFQTLQKKFFFSCWNAIWYFAFFIYFFVEIHHLWSEWLVNWTLLNIRLFFFPSFLKSSFQRITQWVIQYGTNPRGKNSPKPGTTWGSRHIHSKINKIKQQRTDFSAKLQSLNENFIL